VISALFLSMLWLGLILGVFAMLAGVERRPKGSGEVQIPGPIVSREALVEASREISARFHVPGIAAFATVFGAVGYPLSRYSGLEAGWQLLISSLAGGCALAGAFTLIARWALPSARRDVPDERYLLQGMLAQVTDAIEAQQAGRIALRLNGMVHAVQALSLSGDSIDSGTEVVIERIEGETAFVEPWSVVERRL
jgi:membrane protein implicated in regulation of membrane protease activity